MKIIVSNIIQINKPSPEIVNYCKTTLTFRNPEYFKKQQMGFSIYKTPKYISLYDFDEDFDSVYLPVGCLQDIKKLHPNESDYGDFRVTVPRKITSNINLRSYQEPVVTAVKEMCNGIVLMMCGGGKTESCLATAAELKQHTLFIAHTKDLVNQAKERCEKNLNCTTSLITDGKVDLSGDIVFATVQTLHKKLFDIPQDTFGFVVCDECHKIAANADSVGMFRTCMDYFAAKYKLGLTATLHRADGLEVCIPKIVGDVIYEIKEDGSDYVGVYKDEELVRFAKNQFQVPVKVNFIKTNYQIQDVYGNFRDVFDKSGMTISFSKLLTDLANDKERNDMIVDVCKAQSGSTIILSDRVDQLKYFATKIPNSVQIDGNTKVNLREQALEDVKCGKKQVLLASYKLAKEGLDCKILENVIFATPIKDEAIVIQSIGRAQRPFGDKTLAKVFDFVDDVSTLNRFYTKRRSVYKRKDWL